MPLIAFAVVLISLVALVAVTVQTVAIARRQGGQPAFSPTYRAYGV